jgi:hypothetical protein
MDSNEEVVVSIKDFEGRTLREVKVMGPNNWAMIFESEDGTKPSLNFLTGTNVIAVRAKE